MGTPYRLPEPVETVIFRVAQEALTNAVRHSGVAHIESRLEFDPDCVRLVIHARGRGAGLGRDAGARVSRQRKPHDRIPPGHGVEVVLEVPTD